MIGSIVRIIEMMKMMRFSRCYFWSEGREAGHGRDDKVEVV